MTTIFAALATLYSSAAQCAAALGISRQAYCQALKRRRLSDAAAIRAAALLDIDPGQTLLANATGKDIATPISQPTGNPAPQIQDVKNPPKKQADSSEAIQIMRGNTRQKKCTTQLNTTKTHAKRFSGSAGLASIIDAVHRKITHFLPLTEKRQHEIDCVKWMLCVPKISPDSPRFSQYFSRWLIPEKIAASKARGDFDEITKDCPLYSPDLLTYIQAGIDEYHKFTGTQPKPPQSCATAPVIVKLSAAMS